MTIVDALPRDADLARDLGRRQPVVAGDDDDPDSGLVALPDGVGDLGSGRVEHGDEPEERQIALRILALLRDQPVEQRPAS